jgi:EAL domain-containing protein (putative c-di-GMP-specific phosphodiesterase class I)/GGDEF domain-containing protein
MIAAKAVTSAFQPIVSCETGEVAGFEALARPAKDSGIAHAGILFDMAEKYHATWDVEAITRASAFRVLESFPNGILLFTNSTPEVFCDKRFVDSLYRAVRDIPGLTPSRIVLEITERGGGDDLERIAEQVTELKALGFQIAIDDVGAGTSGLNRIMMLRPHWLKLDRELVSNIDSNRYKLNLIRFMIHFARLSGVNVIAEGIERREELDTLIELGVKYVQGFLIGKPNFSYNTLDEKLSLAMRTKWAASQAARLADPRRTLIGQLAEPAEAVQADSLVREVALRILRLPGLAGVAVLDGTRLVGWASREVILAGARRNDKNLQIGYICGNDLGSLSPTATVTEALEMVAQRENAYVSDPIVISEHDRVSGIVTLKRLLGAAVGEAKLTGGSISGLPTRVDAEKKLRTLIAARSEALDCAFVDIRGFSDYNGACGYESGDKLISDLTGLLRLAATGPRPQDWFIAHLGDDRFLIIGPAAEMPKVLPQIIDRFEREAPATPAFLGPVGAAPEATDPQVLLRLGLRIIHLPNVFTRVKTLRQLTNLEQDVRRTLRAGPTSQETRSIHVRDIDLGDQRATA